MTGFTITCEQSRQLDRIAIEQYGLPGIVLMENAGRGCAEELLLAGVQGRVLIFCGKGNNGGDGFVIARHLANHGVDVVAVCLAKESDYQGDALGNLDVLLRSDQRVLFFELSTPPEQWMAAQSIGPIDWVVDAMLGTGAKGPPRPPYDAMIQFANAISARRLAIDIPSGLDGDAGTAHSPTFRADMTCTFVAPKTGMTQPSAKAYVGQMKTIDIGVPQKWLDDLQEAAAE